MHILPLTTNVCAAHAFWVYLDRTCNEYQAPLSDFTHVAIGNVHHQFVCVCVYVCVCVVSRYELQYFATVSSDWHKLLSLFPLTDLCISRFTRSLTWTTDPVHTAVRIQVCAFWCVHTLPIINRYSQRAPLSLSLSLCVYMCLWVRACACHPLACFLLIWRLT